MNAALQPLRVRISENNGLPWAQTHDYISLCRTIGQLGDPVAYNPAHPQGPSPTDVTQFQVGLACSSINNLPDVFYQLWPSKEWWDHTKSARPLPKRDINGKIMYERTPRQWAPRELLDYPILRNLDKISSEEEPWFLELLVRMDGRIEWTDLLMRMEYPGTTELDEQKFRNRLQQRMARSREKFSMVSWRDTAGGDNSVRDRVLSTLSPAQLAARGGLGSTIGSTPGSTDSQGIVIPVPGRRPRGSRNTANVATQQQPQPFTSAGSSGAASQQQYRPAARVGFSGNDSYKNQPLASPYAESSPHATFPMTGGQKHHSAANTTPPQSWSSVTNGVNGYIQYVGDPESNKARSYKHNQPKNPYAGFMSGKYVKRGTSPLEATPVDQYIPSVSHPSSTGGSDGDVEDEWSGEDERSEDVYDSEDSHDSLKSYDREETSGSEESHDSDDCEDDDNGDGDHDHDRNGGSDDHDQHPSDNENDVEMLSAKVDHRDNRITAQERWKWERYLERDRTGVYNYLDGHITREELFLDIDENQAQLKASLKRVRGEVSDDDEVEEMQSPRIKRNRRGGKSLPGTHISTSSAIGNPPLEPSGEHNRQNNLLHTSRPPTRALGSAVERLHQDRARRPAPKATVEQIENLTSINNPQPNATTRNTNHTIYNLQTTSPQPQKSQNPITQPNPISPSLNEPPSPPHLAPPPHPPTHAPDDPFLSPELFNGMLTGHPSNLHVGHIYTLSQQRAHDAYYARLLTPLATTNKNPEHPVPAPPQSSKTHQPPSAFVSNLQDPYSNPDPQPYIPYNIPRPLIPTQAPTLFLPTQQSQSNNTNSALDFSALCDWNHDWHVFA